MQAAVVSHVSREGVVDVLDDPAGPFRPGDGRLPVARFSAPWLVAL